MDNMNSRLVPISGLEIFQNFNNDKNIMIEYYDLINSSE